MSRVHLRTLAFLVVIGALAYAEPQTPGQDQPLKLRGELVVLDAQVMNKTTALAVKGLSREDFALYEDGVKQHISHFSQDKLPLSVLILLDVSGSVWPDRKSFERLRRGAFEALKLLKLEDEVALMQFCGSSMLLQGFTRHHELILEGLGQLNGRILKPGTAVDRAVLDAASYIRTASNPDSRRAIIAITDDITVAIENRHYVTPITRTHGDALRELFESGSVVCALLYKSSQSDIESPEIRKGIAKQFAESTGGITIKTDQEDIPRRLLEVIERLRSRYTIGYTPSNTSPGHKYRRIRLKLSPEAEKREGDVAVITRKGYYAK